MSWKIVIFHFEFRSISEILSFVPSTLWNFCKNFFSVKLFTAVSFLGWLHPFPHNCWFGSVASKNSTILCCTIDFFNDLPFGLSTFRNFSLGLLLRGEKTAQIHVLLLGDKLKTGAQRLVRRCCRRCQHWRLTLSCFCCFHNECELQDCSFLRLLLRDVLW